MSEVLCIFIVITLTYWYTGAITLVSDWLLLNFISALTVCWLTSEATFSGITWRRITPLWSMQAEVQVKVNQLRTFRDGTFEEVSFHMSRLSVSCCIYIVHKQALHWVPAGSCMRSQTLGQGEASGQEAIDWAAELGWDRSQHLWLLRFNIHLTWWRVIIFHSFYTSWYLLHPPSGINRAWGCKTEILLWRA